MPSGRWQAARFSASVVQQLLGAQFERYLQHVAHAAADCAAAVRRLVLKVLRVACKGSVCVLGSGVRLALRGGSRGQGLGVGVQGFSLRAAASVAALFESLQDHWLNTTLSGYPAPVGCLSGIDFAVTGPAGVAVRPERVLAPPLLR